MQKIILFLLIISLAILSILYLDRKVPHGWSSLGNMPTPRTEVASAALGGKIYIIGGFDSSGRILATVEVYDPASDAWEQAPDLPEARHHAAAVFLKGKLYVIGGFSGLDFRPKNDVFEFDPDTGEWKEKAPLRIARGAFGAAVRGNKIYAIGGMIFEGSGEGASLMPLEGPVNVGGLAVTGELEVYDTLTDSWTLKSQAPTQRHHLAVGFVNELLYVTSGRDEAFDNAQDFANLEIYDPKNDRWSQGPPMPTARSGSGGAATGKFFMVAGGEAPNRATFGKVEVFDSQQKKWLSFPNLSTPRHGLALTVLGDKIYAIGGSAETGLIQGVRSASGVNEVLQISD